MLLWLALTGAATAGAYWGTRDFVRRRLRFVDAVHRPAAPAIAGAAGALIAVPVAALLPVMTVASGVLVGVGVAAGVARGRHTLASPHP
jgi:hypothetical protein